jgi:hypothetical protein
VTVSLSDNIKIRTAAIRLLDFGGYNKPILGGAIQRINRAGSRYVLEVELPPLPQEPNARIFTAKWERALTEGASFLIPQPGFIVPPSGTPLVNGAVSGGTSLPIKGLAPSVPLKEGQWLNVIHNSKRYAYRIAADAVANGSGVATVTLTTMLREQLSNNDVIELAAPRIEGWVESPDWGIRIEPFVDVSRFTITEAA